MHYSRAACLKSKTKSTCWIQIKYINYGNSALMKRNLDHQDNQDLLSTIIYHILSLKQAIAHSTPNNLNQTTTGKKNQAGKK